MLVTEIAHPLFHNCSIFDSDEGVSVLTQGRGRCMLIALLTMQLTVGDHRFEKCRMTGARDCGLRVSQGADPEFLDCTVSGSGGCGAYFTSEALGKLESCTIEESVGNLLTSLLPSLPLTHLEQILCCVSFPMSVVYEVEVYVPQMHVQ